MCQTIQHIKNSMFEVPKSSLIEAWGLLEAFNWLLELGFNNISIELDGNSVVNGFLGHKYSRSY